MRRQPDHQTSTAPQRLIRVVAGLCVVAALTACGAPQGARPDAGESESEVSASTPPPSASDSSSPEPLTQQEQWRANYLASEADYTQAVATTVTAGAPVTVITRAALVSCNLLVAGRPLELRLARVIGAFGSTAVLDRSQALSFVDATVSFVCPDLRTLHVAQKSAARTLARQARAARAQAAAATARREAREERLRRERDAAQAPAPAPPTFFANCSDVEAAGAAPIYAGDPGYSRDLDRDGDGVACET